MLEEEEQQLEKDKLTLIDQQKYLRKLKKENESADKAQRLKEEEFEQKLKDFDAKVPNYLEIYESNQKRKLS